MPEHRVLDLGRVHVEPAHDEHVLGAIGDTHVTGVVHDPDVAGVEPAVGIDRVSGGCRIVEVADHDVVAPTHDLARLAARHVGTVVVDDADLGVRDGPTGGLRDGLGIVLGTTHGDRAGGLGEAVGGDDGPEGEFGAHSFDHLDRHGRRPRHRHPQRGEIERVAVGMVEDREEQRGRPGQHRDLLGGDGREHLGHIEDRFRDDRGALEEAGDDPGLVAERVEEGVDDQIAIALGEADHISPHLEHAKRLIVADHDTLRCSGRSGGEHEIGEIVGAALRHPLLDLGVGDLGAGGDELLERDRAVDDIATDDDDPTQPRKIEALEHADVVVAEESVDAQKDRGAAAADDVGRLTPLVPRVEWDDHRPGDQRTETGDDPFGTVRRPDGHPVAGLEAGSDMALRRRHDRIAQFGEGQPQVALDQCIGFGESVGGGHHQSRDGAPDLVGAHDTETTHRPLDPRTRSRTGTRTMGSVV